MVKRLSDGRRFLLGDAVHLSGALGGEGLNAAPMDHRGSVSAMGTMSLINLVAIAVAMQIQLRWPNVPRIR